MLPGLPTSGAISIDQPGGLSPSLRPHFPANLRAMDTGAARWPITGRASHQDSAASFAPVVIPLMPKSHVPCLRQKISPRRTPQIDIGGSSNRVGRGHRGHDAVTVSASAIKEHKPSSYARYTPGYVRWKMLCTAVHRIRCGAARGSIVRRLWPRGAAVSRTEPQSGGCRP